MLRRYFAKSNFYTHRTTSLTVLLSVALSLVFGVLGSFWLVASFYSVSAISPPDTHISPSDFKNSSVYDRRVNYNSIVSTKPFIQADDGVDFQLISEAMTGTTSTSSVAWGDYDGDGDLDLAIGNGSPFVNLTARENKNQLYRNDNGTLKLAWESQDAESTRDVAWGDYDNDGDLDLAAGNEGNVQLYQNFNGTLIEDITLMPPDGLPESTMGIAWGDYDNDGDLDLAVGNGAVTITFDPNDPFGFEPQQNRIYRNTFVQTNGESTILPSASWLLTSPDVTTSLAWGDYDNDGYLDLLIGNLGPNFLYHNSGTGENPLVLSGDRFTSDNTLSVAWGDYDRDGDLDFAIGNTPLISEQSDRVYRNLKVEDPTSGGLPRFDNPINLQVANYTSNGIAWGDYDNDGDLDLAVGNAPSPGTDERGQPNLLYRYDEGSENFVLAETTTEVDDTLDIAWGDYDNDGDLDLLAGNANVNTGQPDRLYRNESIVLKTSAIDIVPPFVNDPLDVAWGDYDGDGDLDLAVANRSYSDRSIPSRVYCNKCSEDDTFSLVWNESDVINTISTTVSIAWGDVDNDGDLDLALGNGDVITGDGGSVTAVGRVNQIFQIDSVPNEPPTMTLIWTSPESEPTAGLAWGDYDNDGDLDFAVSNGTFDPYPNRIYRNLYVDENIITFESYELPSAPDRSVRLAWGDYDNDGDLDLAVANSFEPNRVYRNDGVNDDNSPRFTLIWNSPEEEDSYDVAWGDYDSDGDLDLAVANSGVNRLYRNNSNESNPSGNIFESIWTSTSETEVSVDVAWGDFDSDGDLDLAFGNGGFYTTTPIRQSDHVYRNDRVSSEGRPTFTLNWRSEDASTSSVAWGDSDGDGDLDLIASIAEEGILLHENLRDLQHEDKRKQHFENELGLQFSVSPPVAQIYRPIPPANADLYSSPNIWANETIPLTYTLTHSESLPVQSISVTYSLNGGGSWISAVAATGTQTTNLSTSPEGITYPFEWNVYESGVFGQSDNVVLRLQATQAVTHGINGIPGPYLYGSYAANTFPFRVRGTQIRVVDENGVGVPNAIVYRIGANEPPPGELIGGADAPFRTSTDGYLSGQGALNEGDRLLALWPIEEHPLYTLYHTSAAPTETGLEDTQVQAGGTQTLTVSAGNPLLLFDLVVSLEWNATQDPIFMAQLQRDLQKTSEELYDWTNGQVALRNIEIYQAKVNWENAHVHVLASNQVRPTAHRGGFLTETTVISLSSQITDSTIYPVTVAPGEIRIGPTWNRYGEPGAIGDDWAKVLAHELSHYFLFLQDTYLGLTDNGVLVPIGSCANAEDSVTSMTDPYLYSEFIYGRDFWEARCQETLAEIPEWDILTQVYPGLISPTEDSTENPGPTSVPYAFTRIFIPPIDDDPALVADTNVNVQVTTTGTIDNSLLNGQAYLIRENTVVIDLGHPVAGAVNARGARVGDLVCVFANAVFDCDSFETVDTSLFLSPRTAWQPDITLSPINTATLQIRVEDGEITGTVTAAIYPDGNFLKEITLTLGMTEVVTLEQPALDVYVDIKGVNPNDARVVTGYAIGSGPGRAWSHGPYTSGDGGAVVYPPSNLSNDDFMVLQTATALPSYPDDLLEVIGRAYEVRSSSALTIFDGGSIAFQYLELDVLLSGSPEESLAVYYWDSNSWSRLKPNPNSDFNFVSAQLAGPGLYVLAAGVAQPQIIGFSPTFGYAGQPQTLTVIGTNFIEPLSVRLIDADASNDGAEPVGSTQVFTPEITIVNTKTMNVEIPATIPADQYKLEVANVTSEPFVAPFDFALYTMPPTSSCFFEDFKSGLDRWFTPDGDWNTVLTQDGTEAVTDSPNQPYRSADPGMTLTSQLIISPSISLSDCNEPVVFLRHEHELLQNDEARFEISTDNGITWTPLLTATADIQSVQRASVPDNEWTQIEWQDEGPWSLVELGLLPPSATTLQLRFVLVVDDQASARGWIIDSIEVRDNAPSTSLTPFNGQSGKISYLPIVISGIVEEIEEKVAATTATLPPHESGEQDFDGEFIFLPLITSE